MIVIPLSPPPPNKPRTRAAASAKQTVEYKVVETTKPSTPKTRRRRLVRGPPIRQYKSLEEVCADLRRSIGLSSFRFVKYDTLDNIDRNKFEEAMVEMISNQKISPREIEKRIPKYLFERLERRW